MIRARRAVVIMVLVVLLTSTVGVHAGGMNVCTHMAPDKNYPVETSVGNLRVLNSEWVRDEIPWRIIDWGGKGNFKMPDQEWTTWVDKAVENGIKPLCILGGGNGFYQESDEYTSGHMPTYGTKSGAAKAKEDLYWSRWIGYVEFVATTFKGKIKAYQVWNEPNNAGFWSEETNPPSGVTPEMYAKLYIATRNAIKAIDPDAIVICGSVTGAGDKDIKFTNDILSYIKNNGGLSQIDAYSIHVYSLKPEKWYIDGMNDIYNGAFSKQGYTGPVWMTENGWPAVDGVSVEEQASLAIRFPIMYESFLKSHNTTGENFWYDLKNDGTNASEPEHNFGLMYNNDTPKPAYNSVKIYNKLTNDMNFVSLTKSGSNDIYTAKFQGDAGDVTYVMWTTASTSKSVTVDLPCDTSKVYDYQGNETQRITDKGSKSFTVTTYPTLVYSANVISKIHSALYDGDTNTISINGLFTGGESVTIELLNKSGEVVKSSLANVYDDEFDMWFSADEDGEYTLRVGYPEITKIGGTSGWTTKDITVKKNLPDMGDSKFGTGTLVSYNAATGIVDISGTVENYKDNQQVTILAVPAGTDVANFFNPNSIGYIKNIDTIDGVFSHSFTFPEWYGGKTDVYLSGTGIKNKLKGQADKAENDNIYVGTIDLDESAVSATAAVKNFAQSEKKALIIVAAYKNDELIDIKLSPITVPARTYNTTIYTTSSYQFPDDADRISAYIWSGTENITPLFANIDRDV